MTSNSAPSSRLLHLCRRHLLRECITLLLFASLLLQSATAVAPAPDWWTTRGALMPDADSDDYAAANLGQLKTIAQKAAQEMADNLPGGAGTTITAMIDAWTALPLTGVTRDDYAALTLGQLKTVAQPFYDRLAAAGALAAGSYPWTGTSADDYALANLGQVKTAFAFAVPPLAQLAAQTGIPPALLTTAWQAWQAVPMDQRAEDATLNDLDGDGISNLQEYLMGTPIFDPADIDGDRIPNTVEDLYPGNMSKSRFADAVQDYDGDGVMNYEEILLGLDLAAADSGRSDGLNDAQVLAAHLKQTLPGTVRETTLRSFWDYSIDSLANYNYDDGLLTDHPEWMNTDDGDANGLPDGWEQYLADYVPPVTRSTYTDCDGDHMSDIWEYRYQLDPRDPWDAGTDITTLVSAPLVPTLPQQADYPLLADYAAAVAKYQSDLYTYNQLHAFMLQEDADEDQLCNLREYYLGSNPRLADTDGDATTDADAVAANLDPSGGGANQGEGAKADDDGDGLTNAQELQLGLDPSVSNANLDQDHDSFTDVEEALAGSDVFDSGSRCGPAILVRSKIFGYGASKTVTADATTHIKYTSQYFQGYANNDYGDSFFDPAPQTGTGNLDLANLASSVRSAFESGSFGGSDMPAYPSIYFGNDRPTATYCTTFTTGYDTGNVQNEEHKSWGHAKEFTIIGATIPNPPAASWTRMYLVTKFTGDPHQGGFESDLTDGTEAGIIVFSQDEDGNQNIAYQGSDTDAIQVVADTDGKESLVIMPLQVDEQVISYRLSPVTIEFAVPDVFTDSEYYAANDSENDSPYEGGSGDVPDASNPDSAVDLMNSAYKPATELRVARMEDSLFGANDTNNSRDFNPALTVTKDKDFFQLKITSSTDLAYLQGVQDINAILRFYKPDKTADQTDQKVLVEYRAANGRWPAGLYSRPLLLVSNNTDHDDAVDSNKNSVSHQMIKVPGPDRQLKVMSVSIPTVGSHPALTIPPSISLPAARTVINNLPISFYVLNNADTQAGNKTLARIQGDVDHANQCLLQAGIQITIKGTDIIAPPASLAKSKQMMVKSSAVTNDESLISNLIDKSPTEVAVVYVNQVFAADEGEAKGGLARFRNAKPKNANIIYMSAGDFNGAGAAVYFTLSHELVHLFTQKGHYGIRSQESEYIDDSLPRGGFTMSRYYHNLMNKDSHPTVDFIYGNKRIHRFQQKIINTKLNINF